MYELGTLSLTRPLERFVRPHLCPPCGLEWVRIRAETSLSHRTLPPSEWRPQGPRRKDLRPAAWWDCRDYLAQGKRYGSWHRRASPHATLPQLDWRLRSCSPRNLHRKDLPSRALRL